MPIVPLFSEVIMKKEDEINENELTEEEKSEEELQAERAEREKLAREAYARRLRQEKIEMMQEKQGVIPEKPEEEPEPPKKYTFFQKVGNFLYHYKITIIAIVFALGVGGFLTYDMLTTPNADCMLLYTVYQTEVEFRANEQFNDYFTAITPDVDGDGKNTFDTIWMGIPLEADGTTYQQLQSSVTLLTAHYQTGEALLVVCDEDVSERYDIGETLVDLRELYPDNEHVGRYGFYLKGTKFAETMGLEDEQIPETLFIGIRTVQTNASYGEKMQKNYDVSMEILDKFITDMSE